MSPQRIFFLFRMKMKCLPQDQLAAQRDDNTLLKAEIRELQDMLAVERQAHDESADLFADRIRALESDLQEARAKLEKIRIATIDLHS
eukprot:m.141816 g.141816  ORF g.141816 m.141816 type:complete len:88 (-) comp20386_c0_seq4:64-327(-)